MLLTRMITIVINIQKITHVINRAGRVDGRLQEKIMGDSGAALSDKACIVVGVGEGLGAALGRRFATGYKVGF